MANNDGGSSFALGFILGGIVGAVVGILIAPRPGSETRASLVDQSETWRTRAEELAATVRERVGPTVESVRERVGPTVEGVRERVAPAVENVRERVGPVVEQVSSRVRRRGAAGDEDGTGDAEASADTGGRASKAEGSA